MYLDIQSNLCHKNSMKVSAMDGPKYFPFVCLCRPYYLFTAY